MPASRSQIPRTVNALDDLIQKMTAAIASGSTSVVKLAAATGLSRMQLYRIINRENTPSLNAAEAIARELGFALTFQRQKKTQKSS